MAIAASASGRSLSSGAGALTFECDGATGLYRISSGGAPLTESGNRAVLSETDGSASQLGASRPARAATPSCPRRA